VNYDRVTSVARLTQSANYKRIIQQVETALARGTDYYKLRGPVEHDPEYKLVVDVNMLAVEIDNEVNVIHKFVRDKYSRRFPELESMVSAGKHSKKSIFFTNCFFSRCRTHMNTWRACANWATTYR
jgi:U4/U6 small nuclear ribonucleoprotein PRP31